MGQVLFVLNNFLVVLVCAALADLLFSGRCFWFRLLGAAVSFPIVVLWVVFFLGLAGVLSAVVSCGLLALTAFVLLLIRRWEGRSYVPEVSKEGPFSINKLWWFTVLVGTGVLAGTVAGRFLLRGTYFSTDDLSYHAPAAACWLLRDRPEVFAALKHYPLNAEMLSVWFMLPFGSDGMAGLAGLFWLGLIGLVVVNLAVEQGLTGWAALLYGGLGTLGTSVVLGHCTRTFAAVDTAGPAMVLASICFAGGSLWGQTFGEKVVNAVYCGLCCGFAAGCKVTFVPVVFVLFLWMLFGRKGQFGFSERAKISVVFLAAAVATGSFWYIRNIVLTGNPVFPGQLGPIKGPFMSELQYRTKLISFMISGGKDWSFWWGLIKGHARWPVSMFVVSSAGYAGALYFVLSGRGGVRAKAATSRYILLTVGLALLVLYPWMPFSGANNSPNAPMRISLRFLIVPFMIGIALFLTLVLSKGFLRFVWSVVFLAAVAIGWNYTPRTVIGGIVVISAALFLLLKDMYEISFLACCSTRAAMYLFLPSTMAALAFWAPYQQERTDSWILNYEWRKHHLGEVWSGLQTLPAGSCVTYFGPVRYQYYPLFGRRLQLVPCSVGLNGRIEIPLYKRWRQDPTIVRWWEGKAERVEERNANDAVANLSEAGVDYVLTVKSGKERWLSYEDAFSESTILRKVSENEYGSCWEVMEREVP
jgi:hypothetical protein